MILAKFNSFKRFEMVLNILSKGKLFGIWQLMSQISTICSKICQI